MPSISVHLSIYSYLFVCVYYGIIHLYNSICSCEVLSALPSCSAFFSVYISIDLSPHTPTQKQTNQTPSRQQLDEYKVVELAQSLLQKFPFNRKMCTGCKSIIESLAPELADMSMSPPPSLRASTCSLPFRVNAPQLNPLMERVDSTDSTVSLPSRSPRDLNSNPVSLSVALAHKGVGDRGRFENIASAGPLSPSASAQDSDQPHSSVVPARPPNSRGSGVFFQGGIDSNRHSFPVNHIYSSDNPLYTPTLTPSGSMSNLFARSDSDTSLVGGVKLDLHVPQPAANPYRSSRSSLMEVAATLPATLPEAEDSEEASRANSRSNSVVDMATRAPFPTSAPTTTPVPTPTIT